MQLASYAPDRTPTFFPSVDVKLHPDVQLVPIQVAVMYSDNYQPDTDLAEILQLFDQVPSPAIARFTNGATGETETVTRNWAGLPGPRTYSWMRRPSYEVRGQTTPDEAWGRCGVQFRLVNYFTVHGVDRQVIQRVARGAGTDPDDPYWYPKGTTEGTPCADVADLVTASPAFDPTLPLLVFQQRSYSDDSPERARALLGRSIACVGFNFDDRYPTLIAHELGHMAGMSDCNKSSSCNAMVSAGGGEFPPVDRECNEMKTWAAGKSARFR